jgi:hypothetical protein
MLKQATKRKRQLTEAHKQALRLLAERIVDRHVQRQQKIASNVVDTGARKLRQ